MGYEVHVVLTSEWTESKSHPVTKAAVDQLIAADRSLSWSTTDYIDMKDTRGTVTRYFLINWNGMPVFWWYASEILCKDPTDAQLLKLVEMAHALGGRVLGDDGEQYERGRSVLGTPKVVILGR